MLISPPKQVEFYQPTFFESDLGNHGHCRWVIGEFIELITAKALGGQRHKCSGEFQYCPDISAGEKYFECKAMGKSNQTLVYQGRLHKDRKFVDAGNDLYYAIWSHGVNTLIPQTIEEMQTMILLKLEWLAIIPFYNLEQFCLWRKPERLNSKRYGSSDNPLYGSGYRIPRTFIEKWKFLEWECDTSQTITF